MGTATVSGTKALNTPRALRIVIVGLALAAGLPVSAQAQIYAWRDGTGTLVLSDRPKDGAAPRTYAVGPSNAFRTTRPSSGSRAAQFDNLIAEHSSTAGVRPELVRAVIQAESAFNPMARSVKGAMGLMQLMPATAAELGVINPYNPAENVRAGVTYLKRLLVRFGNNEELALAAYNAGPGAVAKYKNAVPPYKETRDYVKKIQNNAGGGRASAARIYKTVEIMDGREVTRYSNSPAAPSVVLASNR